MTLEGALLNTDTTSYTVNGAVGCGWLLSCTAFSRALAFLCCIVSGETLM